MVQVGLVCEDICFWKHSNYKVVDHFQDLIVVFISFWIYAVFAERSCLIGTCVYVCVFEIVRKVGVFVNSKAGRNGSLPRRR